MPEKPMRRKQEQYWWNLKNRRQKLRKLLIRMKLGESKTN